METTSVPPNVEITHRSRSIQHPIRNMVREGEKFLNSSMCPLADGYRYSPERSSYFCTFVTSSKAGTVCCTESSEIEKSEIEKYRIIE